MANFPGQEVVMCIRFLYFGRSIDLRYMSPVSCRFVHLTVDFWSARRYVSVMVLRLVHVFVGQSCPSGVLWLSHESKRRYCL